MPILFQKTPRKLHNFTPQFIFGSAELYVHFVVSILSRRVAVTYDQADVGTLPPNLSEKIYSCSRRLLAADSLSDFMDRTRIL